MDDASIENARRTLGEIVDRARLAGQATMITRQGKPAAVLIPVPLFELTLRHMTPEQRLAAGIRNTDGDE